MQQSQREEIQQMIQAARFYYEDGLTQESIARELGISRPTISRLLQKAKDDGIVQISISDPFSTDEALADQIVKNCGLQAAIIVPSLTGRNDLSVKRLGLAAAHYLEQTLKSDDILGVGWGRTLHAVSQSLAPTIKKELLAVPLWADWVKSLPIFRSMR